jgi:plastocyanin
MAPVCRRLFVLVAVAVLFTFSGSAAAATRIVHVGLGGTKFVDEVSGTSTSTIVMGDSVSWVWSGGFHSTTSGTCTASACTGDGIWDSGEHSGTFTYPSSPLVFNTLGTFHYFCTVHDTFMQGDIVVVPSPPAPSVSAVAPASGPAGSGTAVVITGADFLDGATVKFATVSATGVVFQDATTIQATTPDNLIPGSLNDVTVTNPDLQTGTLVKGWFADFLDVAAGDAFHDYVEKLVRNGVTAGCGSGNYCRNDSVTRAQMAVFLLKSKLGSAHVPPACTGTVFDDVPCTGGPFDPWIEELASLQITGGCQTVPVALYCPGNSVNRQQMAVFLLKAKLGSDHVPPACTGTVFDDVPCTGGPFDPWIEELAAAGVTGGCQTMPPLYCPTNPNTRGQMAVFLVKNFSLP